MVSERAATQQQPHHVHAHGNTILDFILANQGTTNLHTDCIKKNKWIALSYNSKMVLPDTSAWCDQYLVKIYIIKYIFIRGKIIYYLLK